MEVSGSTRIQDDSAPLARLLTVVRSDEDRFEWRIQPVNATH